MANTQLKQANNQRHFFPPPLRACCGCAARPPWALERGASARLAASICLSRTADSATKRLSGVPGWPSPRADAMPASEVGEAAWKDPTCLTAAPQIRTAWQPAQGHTHRQAEAHALTRGARREQHVLRPGPQHLVHERPHDVLQRSKGNQRQH